MSWTYDPTTAIGQVRLLSSDRDAVNVVFQDEELTGFLSLNGQNVRLAAAQALDQMASNEAFIQGKTRLDELYLDGTLVAAALKAQADELRRQVVEGVGDPTDAGFDWAEQVFDPFTEREIFFDRALRGN